MSWQSITLAKIYSTLLRNSQHYPESQKWCVWQLITLQFAAVFAEMFTSLTMVVRFLCAQPQGSGSVGDGMSAPGHAPGAVTDPWAPTTLHCGENPLSCPFLHSLRAATLHGSVGKDPWPLYPLGAVSCGVQKYEGAIKSKSSQQTGCQQVVFRPMLPDSSACQGYYWKLSCLEEQLASSVL